MSLAGTADALLRAEGRFSVGRGRLPWRGLATLLVLGGFGYGAAMGSWGTRPLQSLYSGVKVPLLLAISSAVCLPNFFVVNSILGLRDDFSAACRGVFAAQATVAVALVALAPVTATLYASSGDYDLAIVGNGAMFLIGTIAGQWTLQRHYRPLVARDPRHRIGRNVWLTLYVFVAIQLAWVLRPFIGASNQPTQFFRDEAWSNAYVVVSKLIWSLLAG